jgi:hypothetical protein
MEAATHDARPLGQFADESGPSELTQLSVMLLAFFSQMIVCWPRLIFFCLTVTV